MPTTFILPSCFHDSEGSCTFSAVSYSHCQAPFSFVLYLPVYIPYSMVFNESLLPYFMNDCVASAVVGVNGVCYQWCIGSIGRGHPCSVLKCQNTIV